MQQQHQRLIKEKPHGNKESSDEEGRNEEDARSRRDEEVSPRQEIDFASSHQARRVLWRAFAMPSDLTLKTFSTAELCALIPGITPRQIQWWVEQDVIPVARVGWARQYQMKDALTVAIIADLRRKGLPLQRIRAVLRLLQRETGRLLSAIRPRDDRAYLAVYGTSVVIETSPERLLDHLGAVSQHCYVVDVAH